MDRLKKKYLLQDVTYLATTSYKFLTLLSMYTYFADMVEG